MAYLFLVPKKDINFGSFLLETAPMHFCYPSNSSTLCRSVTIERYFAIVHPLKHFSAKKFLLLASVVAALLYNVPKFYEFEKKVGAVCAQCR